MTRKLTFNLPDLIYKFIEGGSGNVGIYVSPGLPNITGCWKSADTRNDYYDIYEGAFTLPEVINSTQYIKPVANSTLSTTVGIVFNAALSNPIYGNSSTVQPNALYMTYVIKY